MHVCGLLIGSARNSPGWLGSPGRREDRLSPEWPLAGSCRLAAHACVGLPPEPWLSDCRTLSDAVGQMSDTVGCCRTVGCRSCRTTVGRCRMLSDAVGLVRCLRSVGHCRTVGSLSDCRTVGHCRTLSVTVEYCQSELGPSPRTHHTQMGHSSSPLPSW